MKLEDLIVESFDLKDYNLKKINKKQIIEIFSNYNFKDIDKKINVIQYINLHELVFGWLYKNFIIMSINDKLGYNDWHFLDLNHLDSEEQTYKNISSMDILNVVFNIIYNKMILKDKLYSHRIQAPDKKRFLLYKTIIEKVIKKYNLEYEIKYFNNYSIKLVPIFLEGFYKSIV